MHDNFFIHSSVVGHQGCFHVLAIVSSAAVNIGIHVSFSVLVSSGYMPSSGIVGSIVLFLIFHRISIPFSIIAVWVYIPTNRARRFPFFHISPAFLVSRFFDDGQCEVIPHCSFDFLFSNNEQC